MSKSASGAQWASPAFWGNAASLLLLAALAGALLTLQTADWWVAAPGKQRWIGAAITLLLYLAFCTVIFWRTRPRLVADEHQPASSEPPLLVAYASQTGFAQQLAERTADALRSSGLAVKLRSIEQVDNDLLAGSQRVLFIASTTGEGDPPDPALAFVRGVMGQATPLGHLSYAVLALGDREYDEFCGFGHQLDNWMRQHGAAPLFDLVEVDNADQSALRHWQHHLGQISGVTDLPDWTPAHYESWTLLARNELNRGSVGGGAFHLTITPPAGAAPLWQAGDIAEIGPRNASETVADLLGQLQIDAATTIQKEGEPQALAEILLRSHLPSINALRGLDADAIARVLKPLPHREYSIASLPDEGSLQLLVRRMTGPDGVPGIGSGWLCDYANPGNAVAVRIRSNPNFHPPATHLPMILIGNGTGIAGLRGHLRARVNAGARRNWLLFGERNATNDFFFADEILQWQAQGFVERLDLAFSRDQPERCYVQHKLAAAADTLRDWIDAGASIYVCGSLAGMAPGVDSVLRNVLGDEKVERLLAHRRYRRDVY